MLRLSLSGKAFLCKELRQLWGSSKQTVAKRPIFSYSRSNSVWPGGQQRLYLGLAVILPLAGLISVNQEEQPIKHGFIALQRCIRVGGAAVISMIDYKRTLSRSFQSEKEKQDAYSKCHTRSAQRVLRALLDNGGIYIKLGQHLSSLIVIPREWSSTMRPLQDQCEPTPYYDIQDLFLSDTGFSINDVFYDFDPVPIGVASLAQVHVATYRETGERVAVKLQHPHLDEFTKVDMKTVEILLGWVKYWFPEFEFTWLVEEMKVNLPKEMDFTLEAENAARTATNFAHINTSLHIPKVLLSTKRVLVMEFIQGGRIDDKSYLALNNIDRNKVALELQRIFTRMVHLDGWFHADPHLGNLLVRPSPLGSRSPYNFEIALLDHGLYFDLDTDLRLNYSKMWISLIDGDSPTSRRKRRKYAQLVGNIGPDLYPVFEAAITGRISLDDVDQEDSDISLQMSTVKSIVDLMPQTQREKKAIIDAIVNRGGVLESVFELLRKVPRRVLMVLKLNDLTRNLDQSLDTTHGKARIFLILARNCSLAVWKDEKPRILRQMRQHFFQPALWLELGRTYWNYQRIWTGLRAVELWMDASVRLREARLRIMRVVSLVSIQRQLFEDVQTIRN